MTREILAVLIMLGMFGTLGAITGCNTVAGAGTDIQQGGEAIHDSAKDVQRKM
jgi:predicted small secreted protein